MGLTRDVIAFLLASRGLGADYEQTLMLGRQWLLVDHGRLRASFRDAGERIGRREARELVAAGAGYSEPLLRHLGARAIESLDASSYENGTIIHDLNLPLPARLHRRFSVVLDGGTLEHVFDYPAALRSAMEAVRPGGHFVGIAPVNGYAGHGFYQLSPEVFYRRFAPENGFVIRTMLLKPLHWRSRWRVIPDPKEVGGRVVWRSAWPTLLYVLAERIATPTTSEPVMQSDYEHDAWHQQPQAVASPRRTFASVVRSSAPVALKEIRDSYVTWAESRSDLQVVRLDELSASR
jgi:SAM-dependent methyltransferase